jgi:hypothetical protein
MERFLQCENHKGERFQIEFDKKISKRNFLNAIDEYDYSEDRKGLDERIKLARLFYTVKNVNKSFGYSNVK